MRRQTNASILELKPRSVDLSGAPNLIQLEIRTTKLTDQGVTSLNGLEKLQLLRLVVCDITDAGLRNLADLPALEILDLRYTSVRDSRNWADSNGSVRSSRTLN
jgi:hypothetical protein